MNRRDGIVAYALVVCALLFGLVSRATESFSGSWTIQRSDEPGKVQFALIHHQHGHNSTHDSAWPVSAFVGLDLTQPGKHDVKFSIIRDAGRFDCEGFVDQGEGAGVFHFLADSKYAAEMKSLGFIGIDEEKQFSMAVMDVSLDFAREMKGEHLLGLDTDKLVAFRIFNVNSQFIKELRDAGINVTDCDKLVAFRIHGVTAEMVRYLHGAGYQPTEDQLIAMRIHGITPEFIAKVESLGYKHPDSDQLIAMRIHGVTPEYISAMKARGIKDLSIDQLVTLRIQGID